jgi:heme A synthase
VTVFSSPIQEGIAVRPKTIVYFERIIFGTLLLGVLQSVLGWNRVIAAAPAADRNSAVAFTLAILIFTFVLIGTLTLLVSRRRSKIAMWISIALFVLGLPSFVQTVIRGVLFASNIIAVLQAIAQGVAYGLLFTPSARRWMSRKDERAKLHDVFD